MKIEIKGITHYRRKSFPSESEFFFFTSDMSQCGYARVCAATIELEIPDNFDPIAGQVDVLKQQRAKVLAEFQSRVNEIDDALAKLLCLEHVVVEAV